MEKSKVSEYLSEYLDEAQIYANKNSGCKKVAVGSILLLKAENAPLIYGCNKSLPVDCKQYGCRRIELYGEDSKNHRLPSDCRSLHSEVDAITNAAKWGYCTRDAILIVTRYPCESCARVIVNAGIKEVYYGRQTAISEETEKIFKSGSVEFLHVKNWTYNDTER